MAGRRWSQVDDEMMKVEYQTGSTKTLADMLNRSVEAIRIRATILGLVKDNSVYRNGSTCHRLNEGSLEASYWGGFILADGHVSNSRLVVAVATRDGEHLLKLADFLNCCTTIGTTKYVTPNGKLAEYRRLAVKDVDNIPEFVRKMDIHQQKTHNPPNLDIFLHMSETVMLSTIIGFIDGDGCRIKLKNRETINIVIKCHKSWFEILDYFREKILQFSGFTSKMKTRLVSDGKYAELRISSQNVIDFITTYAVQSGLPILERKWT